MNNFLKKKEIHRSLPPPSNILQCNFVNSTHLHFFRLVSAQLQALLGGISEQFRKEIKTRKVIIYRQSPNQRRYTTPKIAFLPIFAVFWGFIQFQQAISCSQSGVRLKFYQFLTFIYMKTKMGSLFTHFKIFAYSPPNGPLCLLFVLKSH